MLTEKQLEVAARELCRLREIDPDSIVRTRVAANRVHVGKAWKRVAQEVQEFDDLACAHFLGKSTP